MTPLLNKLWHAFDPTGTGFANWKEVFSGLAQVCDVMCVPQCVIVYVGVPLALACRSLN